MTGTNSLFRSARVAVLALLLTSGTYAQTSGGRARIILLPERSLFPVLTANGAEHRISGAKEFTSRDVWVSMGGNLPFVDLSFGDVAAQLSVSGTVYSQLHYTPGHIRVLTNDYYVDVNAALDLDSLTVLRFGIGHTSHHLSDDAFVVLGTRAIDYIRDYVQLFVARDIYFIRGFVYAGVFRHHKFSIPRPGHHVWLVEFGSEFLRHDVHPNVEAYGAFDIKLRQEHRWGTTRSAQAGARLRGESRRSVRFAYTVRSGYDERGQFFDQTLTTHTLGFYIDL